MRLASIIADVLQEYFRVIAVACGLVCRGQVAGGAPVTWRCTRYVALHPNRRGVMPTVRVHCLLEQVKVWSLCAEVAVSHSGEDCFVTVACGLVDMIDLAKAQLALVAVACGLVCRGQVAGGEI